MHALSIFGKASDAVVDACTVNTFKALFEKFLLRQTVKFNFTADLTDRNRRSEVVTE